MPGTMTASSEVTRAIWITSSLGWVRLDGRVLLDGRVEVGRPIVAAPVLVGLAFHSVAASIKVALGTPVETTDSGRLVKAPLSSVCQPQLTDP